MIEFDFTEEESRLFGILLRPVARVKFLGQQGNVLDALLYIDSGADTTLIPRRLGEALGFTVEGAKIFDLGGVGDSKIPAVMQKVTLFLGEHKMECRVAWALTDEVPALLGRVDIFDKFKVTFDLKQKKILFVENEMGVINYDGRP